MKLARGQTSLELILIIGVAVVLGFLFSTYYSSTQPITTGMVMAKNAVSAQLNSLETTAIVENISATTGNGQMTITISTLPTLSPIEFSSESPVFFSQLNAKIAQNSGVTCVNFVFNGNPFNCP